MARYSPKVLTISGAAANTGWIPVDWRAENFKVRYTVVKNGTFDSEINVQLTVANVLADSSVAVGTITTVASDSVSAAGQVTAATITDPFKAIKLNVVSASGAGSYVLYLDQPD